MSPQTLLPSRPARSFRHRVRSRVSEYPLLYLPIARRRYPGPSPEVVGPETRLVIDGYTRSATTFMVYALQVAQAEPVRMAHHLHAPAQLLEAARRNIPTLLLIREPRGALLSQVLREPGVALRDALVAYTRFYERLLPQLDQFVVADFAEVTADVAAVVRRLNARFGLSLAEPTADQRDDVDAFVAQRGSLSPVLLGFESGTTGRATALQELRVLESHATPDAVLEQWRPSADRTHQKELLAAEWYSLRLTPLRERAQSVYRAVLGTPAATDRT
jgi:hypothetical protein